MKKKKKMKVSQTTHKIFTWDLMNPEVQKKSFIGLQDLTKILPSTSSKFTNLQFSNFTPLMKKPFENYHIVLTQNGFSTQKSSDSKIIHIQFQIQKPQLLNQS